MAPHRYWRLYITAGNNTALEIGEVQLRSTSGGADLTGSGTASASTTYSGTYLPANAFDNSNSTAWGSASGDVSSAWLAYDFGVGVSHDIAEAVVQASTAPTYAPKDWAVQWSDDGSAWTTKWTVTGQTAWSASQARTFTAPPGDPQTVLLLHFDGANGQTTTIDSSPSGHAVTLTSAPLSTTQKKFGTTALQSSGGGNSNAAITGTLTDFQFGTGQFTIEAWVYFTSAPAATTYAVLGNFAGSTDLGIELNWNGNNLRFYYSTTGTDALVVQGAFTPTLNQWYHVAVDRDASNLIRLYLNGAVIASATASASFFPSPRTLYVANDGNLSRGFPGYVDEVRISRVARYGGAFTPQTAAYYDAVTVTKANAYAVLSPTGDSRIAVSKAAGYAVLDSSPEVRTSKVFGYAVLHDPSVSTSSRRRPVIMAI